MILRVGCSILLFLIFSFSAFSGDVSALTWEQVVALKKHGVDDRTIQMMIMQEEAARKSAEVGVCEIRDSEGRVITVYSAGTTYDSMGDEERERLNKAWEMLKHIIINGRGH
ncbi:MAG: hypothetical protein N2317_03895 [Syntrophales bacterium]|nr:hypothetical protein [Syntrophales bacterium]